MVVFFIRQNDAEVVDVDADLRGVIEWQMLKLLREYSFNMLMGGDMQIYCFNEDDDIIVIVQFQYVDGRRCEDLLF